MSTLEAIILGIVQGLTEFLPISSTAHVTILGSWFGLVDHMGAEEWTVFLAVIQLGTLAAVLVYFAGDIARITRAFLRENISDRQKFKEQSIDSRLGWYVILGSIPIGFIGLAFKKFIEGEATKDPFVIGTSLIVLALFLWWAEKVASFRKSVDDIGLREAMIVGFAQCLALIPGSSRSGTTITAGLFVGMQREAAARFSFLLSIPAVAASGGLEFIQALPMLNQGELVTLILATLVSALSGYAAIAFLLRFLRSNSTMLFVFYRIAIGLLVLYLASQSII